MQIRFEIEKWTATRLICLSNCCAVDFEKAWIVIVIAGICRVAVVVVVVVAEYEIEIPAALLYSVLG